jgi:hypothetical protein
MAIRCISAFSPSLQNLRALDLLTVTSTHFRPFFTTSSSPQRSSDSSSSEIEAADPFLSKLQKQTEAGYLNLLARQNEVPDTEDDKLAEEELEASRDASNSTSCSFHE